MVRSHHLSLTSNQVVSERHSEAPPHPLAEQLQPVLQMSYCECHVLQSDHDRLLRPLRRPLLHVSMWPQKP